MKTFKKILIFFLIIILAGIAFGIIHVKTITKKGLPSYNASLTIEGIEGKVIIYRDSLAIPHIYAQNEHDLYMATGYCLAQDRLWQMDLLRRVTLGRLSEIFGADYADTDWLLRSLRYSEKSKMLLDSLDNESLSALQAFANGVNYFIENHSNDLPLEFSILKYKPERWEPLHSINLIGYMAWDLKSGWCNLVLDEIRETISTEKFIQLLPDSNYTVVFKDFDIPNHRSTLLSDLEQVIEPLNKLGIGVFDASNNWAISGNKSASGIPYFANDMHLGYNIPGVWYQIHQVVEGKVNVTGVLLPGQPFIIAGHNDSIAWGMTNTYVDNLDFYEEKVNPEDSNLYYYNGEWQTMKIVQTDILTREGDTVQRIIRYTHRGPVMSDIKYANDKVVSMRWMGDEYSNEIRTMCLLNRADNWHDFTNALKTFIAVSQNMNYADVKGNIGLFCAAGVPIRKRDPLLTFLPGETDEYDWKGLVPFEDLPNVYNPASGYVVSANNKTADNTYPYHIGTWYTIPHRMDRIIEMLEGKENISINDFKAIQLDVQSKLVSEFLPVLISEIEKIENIGNLEETGLKLLTNWDGRLIKENKAVVIFETTYLKLLKNVFEDELGPELYQKYLTIASIAKFALDNVIKNPSSPWCDDITTSGWVENFTDMIQISYMEAMEEIDSLYGIDTTSWAWKNVHRITLEHPLGSVNVLQKAFHLNRGPYPVDGSYHTVCPYSYRFSDPFKVHHGASQRHVYNLTNWDDSYSVIPTGNSGIPSSPHYCDQTILYVNGKYHRDLFSKELIEKNAKYTTTITGK